ncbi:MAG: response regulator [Chloroflexi bacterium]|nr:response regulator [Chloroflexota bacterium]
MLDWNQVSDWFVMIVDDEPDNLEVLADVFAFHGAEVITARDGQEGLRQLENRQPDLILLDLSMPNMDGWEMHRRIRDDERLKEIPIIAVTAHAMVGDYERVISAGFDGYITKPINIRNILQDIRQTIEANRH